MTNLLSLNDFSGISVSYSHYITLSGLMAEKGIVGVEFIQCKFSNIQVKGTNKALHVEKSSVLSVKNVVTNNLDGTSITLASSQVVEITNLSVNESNSYGLMVRQCTQVLMMKISLESTGLQGLYIAGSISKQNICHKKWNSDIL